MSFLLFREKWSGDYFAFSENDYQNTNLRYIQKIFFAKMYFLPLCLLLRLFLEVISVRILA